jgi:hypothetical protein
LKKWYVACSTKMLNLVSGTDKCLEEVVPRRLSVYATHAGKVSGVGAVSRSANSQFSSDTQGGRTGPYWVQAKFDSVHPSGTAASRGFLCRCGFSRRGQAALLLVHSAE